MQIIEGPDLPWPVDPRGPRCEAPGSPGTTTGPNACSPGPTHFALVSYPSWGRPTWCVYFCQMRALAVLTAEPLDKPATAELAERIVQHALAMAGKPYRAPTPVELNRRQLI